MDRTGIEAVRDLSLAAHDELLPKTDCPVTALPEGFKITNLEDRMLNRYRFRGQMKTRSLVDFAAYIKERKVPKAVCLIDSDSMTAAACLNFGDTENPGHCDDIAMLIPKKSAEFEALMEVEGSKRTQQDLAEFLEDWRDCIKAEAIGEDGERRAISIMQAISAVRSMSAIKRREDGSVDGHMKSTMTALEEQELKNAEHFPAFIFFKCRPYEDLEERSFVLRTSVIYPVGGKPQIALRMVRKNLVIEEIAKEFAGRVEDSLLDTEANVYMGVFKP